MDKYLICMDILFGLHNVLGTITIFYIDYFQESVYNNQIAVWLKLENNIMYILAKIVVLFIS